MPLIDPADRACGPFLESLSHLFADMDAAYARVAARYGFHCHGCTDNCCQSLFYHHTLLEFLYLRRGLNDLDTTDRNDILRRAAAVAAAEPDTRPMCPLNRAGRCRLYPYRPMVCRLHGIAHTLTGPDHTVRPGPGCEEFSRFAGSNPSERLDRTPFYRRMARLENQLRRQVNFTGRIRMTIARMLLGADPAHPLEPAETLNTEIPRP